MNAMRREAIVLGGPSVAEAVPETAELRAKRKSVESAEVRRRQAQDELENAHAEWLTKAAELRTETNELVNRRDLDEKLRDINMLIRDLDRKNREINDLRSYQEDLEN